MVNPERDLTGLTVEELRRLVGELLGEVARLRDENAALKDEVARLKGHKGRPKIGCSYSRPASRNGVVSLKPPRGGFGTSSRQSTLPGDAGPRNCPSR